jgi:hypothetical protein
LVIAGIVTLIRGAVLAGVLLIVVGLPVGPCGVSVFTEEARVRPASRKANRMWEFRAGVGIVSLKRDFVGYDVEGSDGSSIGKIDKASWEAGSTYLVVDTRFWIFGKKRVIPAGLVERVDVEAETVFVDLSKAEIKAAPDFGERHRRLSGEHEAYYASFEDR